MLLFPPIVTTMDIANQSIRREKLHGFLDRILENINFWQRSFDQF